MWSFFIAFWWSTSYILNPVGWSVCHNFPVLYNAPLGDRSTFISRIVKKLLYMLKLTLTNPGRLRIPTTFNLVQEVAEEYASKIKCPHLLIKATDSTKYMTDENYDRLLKVYRNHNPNFVYRELEGGHHIHLNTPDKVSPLINKFLAKEFPEPDPESNNFDLIWIFSNSIVMISMTYCEYYDRLIDVRKIVVGRTLINLNCDNLEKFTLVNLEFAIIPGIKTKNSGSTNLRGLWIDFIYWSSK